MVAIPAPAKVLVTGTNGYLATWITKKYLEAGYSVRGTVRSLSQSAFFNDRFAHYGERFEVVVVEDITKDGAFDEAVKGVDAIAHTASPFHVKSANPDDPIIPTVRETTSILNSALRCGSTLKRVILTSSIAADHRDPTEPRVLTERSRNHSAAKAVKTRDSAAGPVTIHLASKTLAEKVAWKFVAANGSQMTWDLVVLNSPCVFGPSLSPAPTVDDINSSHPEIYDVLSGARTGSQLRSPGNWVHVAVAAEAHVRATHTATTGGQRIIVKSGPLFYQDLLDLAAELGIPNAPRGELGSTMGISYIIKLETRKSEEVDRLTSVTLLKGIVAESMSMDDFKARAYPGLASH